MPRTELAKSLMKKNIPMTKMRNRRKALKYSLRILSLLTGISEGSLRNYENGTSIPSTPNLVKIANALECTANDLIEDGTEGFDADLYKTQPCLDRSYYNRKYYENGDIEEFEDDEET